MKFQNTNEFRAVRRGGRDKNKMFLTVGAVIIAILAIVVAVMISIVMNMKPKDIVTPPANDTSGTSASPNETTTGQSTFAPDTTVSIIPGNETTVTPVTTETPKDRPTKVDGKYTVCVDPGHGYDDPGTGSDFLGDISERDITMDISLYLRDYLIRYGYNVVMTHEDNIPPAGTYGQYLFNPRTRIAYVNSNFNYDYYISVHCNSFSQEHVSGTRIFYHAPNGANNSEITTVGECLKAGIASSLPDSKTPLLYPLDTDDAYYVLRYAKSLATMLVETGFVTNKSDAAKMLDEQWKKDMAKGIADGIHAYLSGLD